MIQIMKKYNLKLFCNKIMKMVCSHNLKIKDCEKCSVKIICMHDKYKYFCSECNGKGVCKHKKRKSECRDCGGSAYCCHDRLRHKCKECRKYKGRNSLLSYFVEEESKYWTNFVLVDN